MLAVGIVDDEPEVREKIRNFVLRFQDEEGEELRCHLYESGQQVLHSSCEDDILFLDIDMPEPNGMETARMLRQKGSSCILLFVTNMTQYAIQGYEVNALDFMVKPVQYEAFRFKLKKAIQAAGERRNAKMNVKTRDGFRQILLSEILYVEVQRHKLLYHLQGEVLEAWDTIGHAGERLTPHGFAFCNVCYLVNLRHVTGIRDGMVMVGDDCLKISRGKKKAFEEELASLLL